ncbi:hypothetical protein E2R51_02435 [Jeotgalibacillus sp. S-D1]|uniref:replication-relaxation family protein n=1 Tax=Jeotgalibacillus sp. S-D1 TaxID=2552189 RepID=UPI001059E10F|nr:replication-relaxation family protein [Jeotgalibacillus sp. S-D1]TDL34595.1 hypothetical protein E2R51_02435 [Jeotgalibacillus sp. S-D1]
MNQRDKDILDGLKTFRVLNRDQLISMYFSTGKQQVVTCNRVMKRLCSNQLVEVDRSQRPYTYFPFPRTIKIDSTKIPHFKAIADFYIAICKYSKPTHFEVEYKVGQKGSIEPDIYMIWNDAPFFVEIQREQYPINRMEAKFKRYKDYYRSDLWKEEMKHFPFIWMLTERSYRMKFDPLKVYQSKTVDEFVELYCKKQENNSTV